MNNTNTKNETRNTPEMQLTAQQRHNEDNDRTARTTRGTPTTSHVVSHKQTRRTRGHARHAGPVDRGPTHGQRVRGHLRRRERQLQGQRGDRRGDGHALAPGQRVVAGGHVVGRHFGCELDQRSNISVGEVASLMCVQLRPSSAHVVAEFPTFRALDFWALGALESSLVDTPQSMCSATSLSFAESAKLALGSFLPPGSLNTRATYLGGHSSASAFRGQSGGEHSRS